MLALLGGCASDSDENSTPAEPDPRFDASTWPETIGGEKRPAAIYGPSDYDGSSELPLVMILHGYGASGMLQDFVYQFLPRVDTFDFVLILPDGTENAVGIKHWNATEACCNFYGDDVNDSAYLARLLDEAEAAFPIDPDRITVLGHSNGGYMSYRMACDHSERIAAIAPLAGLTFGNEDDCKATSNVSVLHIHGTADFDVEYSPNAFTVGAEESLWRWADRAGCSDSLTDGGRADYESAVAGDETAISSYDQGCADGFTGELWRMDDVGHLPTFNETFRDDLVSWLLAQRNL